MAVLALLLVGVDDSVEPVLAAVCEVAVVILVLVDLFGCLKFVVYASNASLVGRPVLSVGYGCLSDSEEVAGDRGGWSHLRRLLYFGLNLHHVVECFEGGL